LTVAFLVLFFLLTGMVFSFSEDCFLTFQSSIGLLCQNLEQQKQFLFYILYVFFYIQKDIVQNW
jgi:hypothetical protein